MRAEKPTTFPVNRYYAMYELASKFYTNNLYTEEGREAIEYLEKRKITSDVFNIRQNFTNPFFSFQKMYNFSIFA